jgi:2-dehydro-3-deoxygluconokinase
MAFDVVALGEPLYELNRQPDGRFLPGFGGDTSNVVVAAARLGAATAYVSRVGDDFLGEDFLALWREEGVGTSAVSIDADAPTGLYFVTHDARGHHFTYRRKDTAASLIAPADLPQATIASAKFLHVSGISQAIGATARATVDRAIAIAVEAGVAISYDTNYRPSLWPPESAWAAVRAVAPSAALLKTSIEDSAALFGGRSAEDIAQRYRDLGSRIVLVTLGAEGVHVASGDERTTVPGCRVAAVDATGAGDAFTGALLAELARGEELLSAVRFANAAAALSTLGYGAIAPLPRRPEVLRFIAGRQAAGL